MQKPENNKTQGGTDARHFTAPISVAVYTEKYACFWCGSDSEPYYSRVGPMGYVCPDCGKCSDSSPNKVICK